MTQDAQPSEASKPDAREDKARQSTGQDLNRALTECFDPNTSSPSFPERLVRFAAAFTGIKDVTLWHAVDEDAGDAQVLAKLPGYSQTQDVSNKAGAALADEAFLESPGVKLDEGVFLAAVALPAGAFAVLSASAPREGGNVARAVTYERLSMLANMARAQFRHSDLISQDAVARSIGEIARGRMETLQGFVDALAKLTGADYAAAGYVQQGRVASVSISGQEIGAKRAQLPVKLKAEMAETARQNLATPTRVFAPSGRPQSGLAIHLENPQRNTGFLAMAAHLYTRSQPQKPGSGWSLKRLVKAACVALVVGAIGLIPIPDGTDVPAVVEATEQRIITAPLSSSIAQVEVEDTQAVVAGETVLLRMDTQELDIQLIALQAERANAVLERETARASRNAAVLRNAELEVERLDAQAALLELQKNSAVLRAPIDGIVLLEGLDQRVGASVRQGEQLLQIADPNALYLSLSVVERDVSKLAAGDAATFKPDFDPSLTFDAVIDMVSPAVDLREEIPIVRSRAEFQDGALDKLRPGLQGVVLVDRTSRPIWKIVYRNIRNWVLLRVWI